MNKEFYKNNKNVRVININKKPKEIKYDNKLLYLYTSTIVVLILWYILLYSTRHILLKKKYIFIDYLLFILPLLLVMNHLYNMHNHIINNNDIVLEENIKDDLKKEMGYAQVVPIIIFGLGVFLPSKFKYLVLPYLLLSLIFGTIIPFIIMKLGENSNSLELLILKDSMEYCSQSFSFTLIIPALLYPLFVHLE